MSARNAPIAQVAHRGLPPVVGATLRTLILGSFPGVRSLSAAQYYAHPRNRFWPAVADTIGCAPDAPYAQRLAALRQGGLGLWDVLVACERAGSLDQAIVPGTEEPADLGGLVARHPELRRIVLNGRSAAALFARHQLPRWLWGDAGVEIVVAPSTSPAHAATSLHAVREAWTAALAVPSPPALHPASAARSRSARGPAISR